MTNEETLLSSSSFFFSQFPKYFLMLDEKEIRKKSLQQDMTTKTNAFFYLESSSWWIFVALVEVICISLGDCLFVCLEHKNTSSRNVEATMASTMAKCWEFSCLKRIENLSVVVVVVFFYQKICVYCKWAKLKIVSTAFTKRPKKSTQNYDCWQTMKAAIFVTFFSSAFNRNEEKWIDFQYFHFEPKSSGDNNRRQF